MQSWIRTHFAFSLLPFRDASTNFVRIVFFQNAQTAISCSKLTASAAPYSKTNANRYLALENHSVQGQHHPSQPQPNSRWLGEKYFMFVMSLWCVYNHYKPTLSVSGCLETIFIFGIFIVYVLSMMSDPALSQSKRILKHFLSKCLRACVEAREFMLTDSAYPYWMLTKLSRCVGVYVPGWLKIMWLHTQNK